MPLPSETNTFFVARGEELRLSNLGQLELLRAVNARGLPLRTVARGFSMHPFIRDQDVLTIAPFHDRAPRMGDVAAFILPQTGRLAIHRIVGRTAAGWRLKGDNCLQADGVVARENIIGRVTRIERHGRDVRFGLGPEGRWIAFFNRGRGLMRFKAFWRVLRRAVGSDSLGRPCWGSNPSSPPKKNSMAGGAS